MNEVKKRLLKILILTTIGISSINCFAMKENLKKESYYDEDSSNCMNTPVMNRQDLVGFQNENFQDSYNQDDFSRESNCYEYSYNSRKTPVNKNYNKKINGGDKELNLSYEISDKDNEYLNKKTTRKNENILKDKDSQDSYNQDDFSRESNCDEYSYNSMKTPVMNRQDLVGFQNENFQDSYNKIDFKPIQNLKNVDKNEDKKYLYEKNSFLEKKTNRNENKTDNLNKINSKKTVFNNKNINLTENIANINTINLDETKEQPSLNESLSANQFLTEEYKKFIVSIYLVSKIKKIFINDLEKFLKDFESNKNYKLLSRKITRIIANFNTDEIKEDNLKIAPIELSIKITDFLSNTENQKEEDIIYLLSSIMSKIKKILLISIHKTTLSIQKLNKDSLNKMQQQPNFEKYYTERMNKIVKIPFKINHDRVINELKNFNKKDLCYEWLMNINNLISNIKIKIKLINPKNNDEKIYETTISGNELKSEKIIEKSIFNKDNILKKTIPINFNDNVFKTSDFKNKDPKYKNNEYENYHNDNIFQNDSFFPNDLNSFNNMENMQEKQNNNNNEINIPRINLDDIDDIDEKKLYEISEERIFKAPLTENRFLIEEYKKRFICELLKPNLKAKFNEFIKNYIKKCKPKIENNILNNINCEIELNYNPNNADEYNLQFRPIKFMVKLPPNIKEIFKDEYGNFLSTKYSNLLSNLTSNYNIFLNDSIDETIQTLPNLKKENFNDILNKIKNIDNLESINELKFSHEDAEKFNSLTNKHLNKYIKNTKTGEKIENLVDEVSSNKNHNSLVIYNELTKIDKNDFCIKNFRNLKYIISQIVLMAPAPDTDEYQEINGTNISGDILQLI